MVTVLIPHKQFGTRIVGPAEQMKEIAACAHMPVALDVTHDLRSVIIAVNKAVDSEGVVTVCCQPHNYVCSKTFESSRDGDIFVSNEHFRARVAASCGVCGWQIRSRADAEWH